MIGYSKISTHLNKKETLNLTIPVFLLVGFMIILFLFLSIFKYNFGFFLEGTLVEKNKIRVVVHSSMEKEILECSQFQIGNIKYFIDKIEIGEIILSGGVALTEIYFTVLNKDITTKYIKMKLIIVRTTLLNRLISQMKGE